MFQLKGRRVEQEELEGYLVEVTRRPRQRSIRLKVSPRGTLHLSCAASTPREFVQEFLRSRKGFIQKALMHFQNLQRRFPDKSYAEGEVFPFLGRWFPLLWERSVSPAASVNSARSSRQFAIQVLRDEAALKVIAPPIVFDRFPATALVIRSAILAYYRHCAKEVLLRRMAFWATKTGLQPKKVSLRGQRSRWGSCSTQGHISLNFKLVAAPLQVIDYIVVHELCHLIEPNHSPAFWKKVGEHFPTYAEAEQWLAQNQPLFRFMDN